MKHVTLAAMTLVLSAGYAFAGGGAPVPAQPSGGDPSGRPGAILDDAKCTEVWSMAQREGDVLVEGKADPFIVNWNMVDLDKDGKVTADEFKNGCKGGWVQASSAEGSQAPSGTASPDVPKE